jgi:hypothetical protein
MRWMLVSVSILLSACGGGSSTKSTTTLSQLEASGALPVLDRSASLRGTDADSNGVRDDVDSFVTSKLSAPTERAAALQYARAVQSAVLVDSTNPSDVAAVRKGLSRATRCLYQRFWGTATDPDAISNSVNSVTLNTKARLLAYLAYDKSLSGRTFTLETGASCE